MKDNLEFNKEYFMVVINSLPIIDNLRIHLNNACLQLTVLQLSSYVYEFAAIIPFHHEELHKVIQYRTSLCPSFLLLQVLRDNIKYCGIQWNKEWLYGEIYFCWP